MSIQDFIARKKQELFLARDNDKLEIQRKALIERRKELEYKSKLQNEIRKEQTDIRQLRSEPTRRTLGTIKQGFSNLVQSAGKFQENVKKAGNDKPRGPFAQTTNPFGRDEPKAKPSTAKGKTINIRIKT